MEHGQNLSELPPPPPPGVVRPMSYPQSVGGLPPPPRPFFHPPPPPLIPHPSGFYQARQPNPTQFPSPPYPNWATTPAQSMLLPIPPSSYQTHQQMFAPSLLCPALVVTQSATQGNLDQVGTSKSALIQTKSTQARTHSDLDYPSSNGKGLEQQPIENSFPGTLPSAMVPSRHPPASSSATQFRDALTGNQQIRPPSVIPPVSSLKTQGQQGLIEDGGMMVNELVQRGLNSPREPDVLRGTTTTDRVNSQMMKSFPDLSKIEVFSGQNFKRWKDKGIPCWIFTE